MKYFTQKKCNNCHARSKGWTKLFPLNDDQNLVQCGKCGLIFNDRCRIDFSTIYQQDYYAKTNKKQYEVGGYYDYPSMKEKVAKDYKFAIDFIQDKLKRAPWKKKAPAILDVGAGFGFFLEHLGSTNVKKSAIEISDLCVAYMKKHTPHVDVKNGDFLTFKFKQKFDVICMFGFIEHVVDPALALKKAYRLLNKNGILILTAPNAGNLSFKILRTMWPAIHPKHHNYYFTQKTLVMMLGKVGFNINLVQETHFLHFSYFHIRQRLTSFFPKLAFIMNLFSLLDDTLLPTPSGGSLHIIAQKKV